MKLLIITILTLFFGFQLKASHIVGGDMYYDCVGENTYEITIRIYRDCLSDGADFDVNLPVTVFNGLNVQIDYFTIPVPPSDLLDVIAENPCITLPSDICVEEAIYKRIVTLPPSPTGYILSYQRCCRGPAVLNIFDPGEQGLTLQCNIPPPDVECNSSARFTNYPPLVLCAGQDLVFDHSATDPDGDNLVYELCTPFHGGTSFFPAPDPAAAPPYDPVPWAAGFSEDDPFGDGELSIDAVTGSLEGVPNIPGLYTVGVCVNEFRDGELISTTRRDFLFTVLDCEIELEAEMVPQLDLATFMSYCQGLEVQFENESYGGDSYKWDFGVPEIGTDVSTEFEPSYTYPGPGTYLVMLIVNPGQPCTDTAFETFIVENEITAEFTPPDPQCITGNSFDFSGEGIYPPTEDGTTFEWDFGEFATPLTADIENPTNIVFSTPGVHEVTYTVNYEVCSESHTEEIIVYPEPTINFTVDDELKCAPYTAEFINLSTAGTPMYYSWDFGDGIGTSSEANPVYIYNEVGVYDVSLIMWTDAGCIDTLSLLRENLIEVFPRPTAGFTVTPAVQDEYHADFFFTDASVDGVEHWFYFADGFNSQEDEVWHNYTEPGVYYPYQIVINEFGCKDRAQEKITIIPVIPVMVPNAFTPDGNSLNNIFQPIFYESQVFELYIYNRWGELIYSANEMDGYWDGSFRNGQLAPDGVYIWKIVYTDYQTDLPVEIGGHVTLLK
ncbi:PKD domain-containing protein [Crocinitomix sp.]|nr:PKD domain-containing protein [Crocinitomix sp.]